jgi:uncharacterized protein YgiM (DUF1202 family)
MNRILAVGCALAVIAAPAASFAAPLSSPKAPAAVSGLQLVAGKTMTATIDGTQVKKQPLSSSKTVSTLASGTTVNVLDKTANGLWVHIQIGSTTGYVPAKALK